MRIAFLKKHDPAGYNGGDAIYDRKLIAALRDRGDTVSILELSPASMKKSLGRLVFHGGTVATAKFDTPENRQLVRQTLAEAPEALIVSHEALVDVVTAVGTELPTLFILHNVMSLIEGDAGLHGVLKNRARASESRAFGRPNYQVAVLSHRERIALERLKPQLIHLMPPGLGKLAAARPSKLDATKIFVHGSTEWGLKRRDWTKLIKDPVARQLSITTDALEDDGVIRIGLVPDRFLAGFKLKAMDYIAQNCAVISLSEVRSDFPPQSAPENSIQTIENAGDIPAAIAHIVAHQDLIAREIEQLKEAWRLHLTWASAAAIAVEALQRTRLQL